MSEDLTPEESQEKASALAHPIIIPAPFKGWLERFAALCATDFLVIQADGWRESRFVTAPPVETNEAGRVGYGDLSTVGPIFPKLSDGTYLFLYGFFASGGNGSGDFASAVLSINGNIQGEEYKAHIVTDASPGNGSCWTVAQYTLANDNNNTVKLVYKSSDTTMRFDRRWLHAVKIHPIT